MKRIVSFVIALAALGVFASACSKKATPGTPSNSQPTTFFFHADALPANELAPNNVPSGHAEAAGRAFASVTLKVTRDGAGTITNGTLDYGVAVSSFPAGTNFTNMHIHRGDATVSGAVVINSGLANGEFQLVNGSGSIQKLNNPVSASLATEIINNPSGFYFNLHSTSFPSGVARGQIALTSSQ